MAAFKPVALYGLEVVANEDPIHAFNGSEFPATFRITMAALDPTAPPNGEGPPRATLKMIRLPAEDDDDEDDEDDEDYPGLDDLLDGEDSDDDEDVNGGPSDPAKSKKAQKAAAFAKLREALLKGAEDEDDDDMDVDAAPKKDKGKGKAAPDADEEDDDDDDDDLDDSEDLESEEFVLCTLDTERHYQQTLDITINEHEEVLFQVLGTHNIHLTGNILLPDDEPQRGEYDEEDEDDDLLYDDEDDLDLLEGDEEDEEDDLDDLDDPRILELEDDDEEEIPKLLAAAKKNKNKRAAEEDAEEADDEPATNGVSSDEPKLSKNQLKKQRKKMKDNAGNAVEVTKTEANGTTKVAAKKEDAIPEKGEKKVQFAEKLVQGPSNSSAKNEPAARVVQGVTIEDKKVGSGPQAKNGDSVHMRYIGKLEKNKKVFDSNKKGKPFAFKLGAGQVIKGWDIGVAGMAVGGERRITIPAHLAYGSKGAKPEIPPNAVLQFDLKVLEVRK